MKESVLGGVKAPTVFTMLIIKLDNVYYVIFKGQVR